MVAPQNSQSSFNQIVLPSNVSKNINLMQNVPVGLFQMNISGYFNLANDEMKKILNVEGYDLYRTNIFSFLGKKSTEEFQQKIRSPKSDDKFIFEFIIEGNNDWEYQVTMTPEFYDDEFKNSWLGAIACLPIKEKKKIQSLSELENLKKEHIMIKEQLAHLCHEVRIPINTIMGMSFLLAENIEEEAKQKYLKPLFTSADFLGKLVNSILDFSKMDGGHMTLHEENYSLNNVLVEIQDAFNMLLKDKPVNFVLENNIKNDTIFGDALRLKQILSNLANNALKFTKEGEIGIRTSSHLNTKNQPMIRFEVFDTGIGIPEHKLQSVFEEYKQADSQIAAKYGGTGLGLSIVQLLVELHHGKIDIESVEGEGTTFIIDIPYKVNTPKSHQIIETEDFPNIDLIKGKKILVFEDDPMGKRLIQHILNSWECKFEILQNGFYDLQRIEDEKFDLILTDINMPEKNGYQIASELRRNGITTPIIALTGNTFEEKKLQAFEAGMNDFIAKPFSFSHLEKTVLKWIQVK
ncbi:MAG: hybrid sensor histidine kinase/response regulator [Saprospiraceae bacterium]